MQFIDRRLGALALLVLAACSNPISTTTPGPTPLAYRHTLDEFNILMRACLEDRGFAVTIRADGGMDFGELGSRERLEQARASVKDCTGKIDPARLEEPPPLSRDQLREMYEYVLAQLNCLEAAGYPAGDPPPIDVFIDSDGAWDPYGDLIERGFSPATEDVISCQNVAAKPDFVDR